MKAFLGIDCGGSTIRTCLVDEEGTIIHRGQAGPGNLASTPQLEIERNLRAALEGCPNPECVAACFAGLLTDADRQRAITLVESVIQAPSINAYADYRASLAALPDTDVIVIAGTGTLIASQTQSGVHKSAGGGPILGDLGSAFDIGRKALSTVVLSPNPGEASPAFWQAVTEVFGSSEAQQVIASVYRSVSPAARIAKLAPIVVFDSQSKYPYAVAAVEAAIAELVDQTVAHIGAYFQPSIPLVLRLSGGLWEIEDGLLIEAFKSQLASRNNLPPLQVEKLAVEPVFGAVNLAKLLQLNHS
jgi:N-acetylglucosamine kinase-like BadF-type ATPase